MKPQRVEEVTVDEVKYMGSIIQNTQSAHTTGGEEEAAGCGLFAVHDKLNLMYIFNGCIKWEMMFPLLF